MTKSKDFQGKGSVIKFKIVPTQKGSSKLVSKEKYKEEICKRFKELWKYGHPNFFDLLIEIADLHEVKNKAYGRGNHFGNFRESERLGIQPWKGVMVRLTDKYTRACNMTAEIDNPEYADARSIEGLDDTLRDMAVYSMIACVLLREAKAKKLYKELLNDNEETKVEMEMSATSSTT